MSQPPESFHTSSQRRLAGEDEVPPGERLAPERWRRDFPIDLTEDEYVSRRDLVKFICLTSFSFVAGQVWIVWGAVRRRARPAPSALAIVAVEDVPVGGARTFFYPDQSTPRLLIRTGPDDFVAWDQRCSHLLCPVVPAVEQGKLHCPCHDGWFDLANGMPLAGPPRRGLARVTLEIRDGTVYATGVEEPAA